MNETAGVAASAVGRIDWPALLRAGLAPAARGGLELRPAEFWDLTPAELALMLGREAPAAMGRARFLALAALHPDAPREDRT